MQRLLIVTGLMIALVGFAWPWISQLPLGRLPGDIVIDKPGMKIWLPITTMIVVSIVASVILWVLRR